MCCGLVGCNAKDSMGTYKKWFNIKARAPESMDERWRTSNAFESKKNVSSETDYWFTQQKFCFWIVRRFKFFQFIGAGSLCEAIDILFRNGMFIDKIQSYYANGLTGRFNLFLCSFAFIQCSSESEAHQMFDESSTHDTGKCFTVCLQGSLTPGPLRLRPVNTVCRPTK